MSFSLSCSLSLCLFFPWVVAQGEHTLTHCVLSKVRLTAAGAHLKHTLIELPAKHIARHVGCTDWKCGGQFLISFSKRCRKLCLMNFMSWNLCHECFIHIAYKQADFLWNDLNITVSSEIITLACVPWVCYVFSIIGQGAMLTGSYTFQKFCKINIFSVKHFKILYNAVCVAM